MARSYVRQNVVNRFELRPCSGERSYNRLFFQISNTSQHEKVGGGP